MKIKVLAQLNEEDIRRAIEDWFVVKDIKAETISFKLIAADGVAKELSAFATAGVEAEVEGTWISSAKSS